MSNLVLPNFDWALSATIKAVKSQAKAAAQVQYRLSPTMRLLPFGIFSKKDLNTHPSLDAVGMAPEHVKLFIAKKLLLGWLYLKRKRMLSANTRCRLAAYVRYSDEILEEIRAGDTDILERWWVVETTFEYSQHSPTTGVPRGAGLARESLECILIEWNLQDIYPVENLALVFHEALDDAADHLGDWIQYEVEREFPSDDDDTTDDGE